MQSNRVIALRKRANTMHKIAVIFITILNLSSHPLPNTVLLNGDEAVEVGELKMRAHKTVKIPRTDSVAVIFKLGKWIGTAKMPVQDTIKITDKTEIFE